MPENLSLLSAIKERYDEKVILARQDTQDNILTIWVEGDSIAELLNFLKKEINRPFRMLYDLTAIDERRRKKIAKRHNKAKPFF